MADVSNGLRVSIRLDKPEFDRAEGVDLVGVFENVGERPFSLTFWWNRSMRITDQGGCLVAATRGPELPCGIGETPVTLAPGAKYERKEPLACTQPAGLKKQVGWSYDLKPGTYRVSLVFENPPAHGHESNDASDAWKGRLESAPVEMTIGRRKR